MVNAGSLVFIASTILRNLCCQIGKNAMSAVTMVTTDGQKYY